MQLFPTEFWVQQERTFLSGTWYGLFLTELSSLAGDWRMSAVRME